MFQEALETVHRAVGAGAATRSSGDSAPFERARPVLEGCLVAQFRGGREADVASDAGSSRARSCSSRSVCGGSWDSANASAGALPRAPRAPSRASSSSSADAGKGKFVVTGLRDPLARDPATLVAVSNLPSNDVEGRWEPYQAIQPAFVDRARASDLLRPAGGRDAGVPRRRADAPRGPPRSRGSSTANGWRRRCRACGGSTMRAVRPTHDSGGSRVGLGACSSRRANRSGAGQDRRLSDGVRLADGSSTTWRRFAAQPTASRSSATPTADGPDAGEQPAEPGASRRRAASCFRWTRLPRAHLRAASAWGWRSRSTPGIHGDREDAQSPSLLPRAHRRRTPQDSRR